VKLIECGSRSLKRIFFLTFSPNNFIYESHCDFRVAKFDVLGESIDEDRNQESSEEESRPEEKGEVALGPPPRGRKF
jgi:hypothetical protein